VRFRVRRFSRQRRIPGTIAVLIALPLCVCLAPLESEASPTLLQALDISRRDDAWEIRVGFESPIRYLRHAPDGEGAVIEISIDPLGAAPTAEALRRGEEVLMAPREAGSPLRDVRVELDASDHAVLLMRFYENVVFDLRSDPNFRSLTVVVEKAERQSPARAAPSAGTPSADLMAEGEVAMLAGDYTRAVALYTLVLKSSADATPDERQRALELLGLARQRGGQIAHARAEYQEYLQRYPDSDGAARVRQRLAALDTAIAPEPAPRRKVAQTAPATTRFDVYGSLYTSYFRTESFGDLSGAELLDSSQIADGDITARLRRGPLELRARAAGYFRYDFREGEVDTPSRVTRLYLDANESRLGLRGRLGRQSSQGAGVLGRFDGITASWDFLPQWTVNAVAGFPLASSVSQGVDTNRQVYGASVEGRDILPGLHAELFAVGQLIDDATDRIAAGIEARYVDEVRSAFGLIDYDFHFLELNVAMLSGSWRLPHGTTVNALFDYRFAPILTTRNALIGQPIPNLNLLFAEYGKSGVEQLAKDRTPRITTLVAGASHRLTEMLDLNGDFTAAKMGGTPSSGGVPGYPPGAWQFYYTAQLVARGWLTESGTERVAIRVRDGQHQNSYALTLGGRYSFLRAFRATPEFRVDYRDNDVARDYIELIPRLRIEYRIGPVTVDVDGALQWLQGVGGGLQSNRDELGYSLHAGARYDF
jgi:tetratricopeptide (TPR) repeat protein